MSKYVRIILLSIMSIFIIFGCAEAEDPYQPEEQEESEILSINKTFHISGEIREMNVNENYIFAAENESGFSIHNRLSGETIVHITNYADTLDSGQIIPKYFENITEIEVVTDSNKVFVYDKYDTAEIYIYDISDINNVSFVTNITGDTAGYSDLRILPYGEENEYYPYSGYFAREQKFTFANMFVYGDSYAIDIPDDGEVQLPNDITEFFLTENYTFVAGEERGLYIIDNESKSFIQEVDTPGKALDVCYSDGYAFIADRQDGVHVIDCYNATDSELIFSYDTAGYAQSIAVKDDLLAVGSGGGGVYLFDISDPAEMKFLDRIDDEVIGYTREVAFYGDKLYVGSRDLGILELNIDL